MMIFVLLGILALIGIDQMVKYWAMTSLMQVGTMPLIPDIFHLTYVENRGAAFSILQGQRWIFLILTPVIIACLLILLYKKEVHTRLGRIAVYLVLSGAIGNFIDRVLHGFVVDLFDFRWIGFPVFNMADIYVVIGVICLFYYYLFQHEQVKQDEN